MPGALTHAYFFQKHNKNLLGCILPDFLPLLKNFDWSETHNIEKMKQFGAYLKKVDKSSYWLAKGMISHIILDKAAIQNKRLAHHRMHISEHIKKMVNIKPGMMDEFSDLFLDIVLDDVIKLKKPYLAVLIENSIRKTNLSLAAKHIGDFFNRDAQKIEKGLIHMKSLNFSEITSSVQSASEEYLQFTGIEKNSLLQKVYGLYLNTMLIKNKKQIEEIVENSKKFLLENTSDNETNFTLILRYLEENHKSLLKQKVYI